MNPLKLCSNASLHFFNREKITSFSRFLKRFMILHVSRSFSKRIFGKLFWSLDCKECFLILISPKRQNILHHKFREILPGPGCKKTATERTDWQAVLKDTVQRIWCGCGGAVQQREPVKSFPKLLSRSSVTQDGLWRTFRSSFQLCLFSYLWNWDTPVSLVWLH